MDLLQTTPAVVISAFNHAGIYVEEQKDRSFIALVSIEKARAGRNIEHNEYINLINGNKTVGLLNFEE